MKIRGEFVGVSRTIDGDLQIGFAVDDDVRDLIEEFKGSELDIQIEKHKEKRSLNANAYFWKLCDEIAKKLNSDKETIYLMKLKDAGVFEVIDVIEEARILIDPLFRYVEEDHRFEASIFDEDGEERLIKMVELHCYKGSHEYNTSQMSRLIESTVQEAKDLKIDTLKPEEVERLCSLWRQR